MADFFGLCDQVDELKKLVCKLAKQSAAQQDEIKEIKVQLEHQHRVNNSMTREVLALTAQRDRIARLEIIADTMERLLQ